MQSYEPLIQRSIFVVYRQTLHKNRAGNIRVFGARKSVLLKASSGERRTPQNFVHLAIFRGIQGHLIVYLVVHQIKYLMER